MEFQHYASTEAATLIARLLGSQSGACLDQLRAVRDALDAAARALETPAHAEHEIQDLARRLTEAAETEARRIHDEAQRTIDAAHVELKGQLDENAKLAAAVARAEAESALLRSELQTANERAAAAERDLVVTVDAHTEVEAALRNAEAERRQAVQARAGLEGDLSGARATLERTLAEAEQLRAHLEREHAEKTALQTELAGALQTGEQRDAIAAAFEASRARVHALENELAAVRHTAEQRDALATELETARARFHALETEHARQEEHVGHLKAKLDAAIQTEARLRNDAAARDRQSAGGEELAEALRGELERMVSLFDASVRAVNEMVNARSSSELLGELVKRLSIQFSRVALFRVKGNRLEGEHQIGFEEADATKLVMPITVDSLLTRAVKSGNVESIAGTDLTSRLGTPFGGSPTSAVALPIVLQGTTLAVVYADDADMPESARGPAVHESSVGFARLLVGEASVLLMCHTHELKTLAELRQYANTLLQEAKTMYLADVEAGKPAAQLRGRLKDNLDCASQLYAYRAAMEGTAAAVLLDEQIATEMDGNTPFARDLAAVAADTAASGLAVTAEAS
jgi:hypothetical protein